jgi:GWxTD domain-containing protein
VNVLRTHGVRLLAVGLLLLAPSTAAVAQSPEDRAALDRFQDSLAGTGDTLTLARLEKEMIEVARVARDSVMLHLRLGVLALRLGELGRRSGYDDAASEFQWAIDLHPGWPWPYYGLGLAEYGILDSELALIAGLQTMFGKDRLTRAANYFAKSAEVDPAFIRGLTDLTSTALQQRVNLRLAVALVALRRSAATEAGRHPDILLARGRVEREVGDPDSSAAAFRAYIATGAYPALGRFELARTELSVGRLAATVTYFDAAAAGDTLVDRMMRNDLLELVMPSEVTGLDFLTGAARVTWLADFWAERDAGALRKSGERVAEHYRRMWYARRNFRLVSTKRQYRIEERFRSYSVDYDDRGLVYIRHGEPSERASVTRQNLPLNQSWRYQRPEGDLIFHFVAREDVQDYKLVESLYDVLGFDVAVALRGGSATPTQRGDAVDLLQSREQLAPIYGRLIAAGGGGTMGLMDRERLDGRRSIKVGTESDSYALEFPAELEETRWEVLGAGQRGGRPLVHLAWAVPGKSLRPVPSTRGTLYPVRVRFALTDLASGKVVHTTDSTTLFVSAQPVPRGEWLVGRVGVFVPPGRYAWRVAVQEGEAGVLSPPDTVTVIGSTEVAVSDLVVGAQNTNLRWLRTPEDTVFFNPAGSHRADLPLELFFEVGGIPEGESYRTEVRITRPSGWGPIGRLFSGGGSISVRFDEPSVGLRAAVQRTIDISRLKPGNYTLEVSVERDGRRIRKRHPFTVVPAATRPATAPGPASP